MPNYYTYQPPNPSEKATPGQGHWEDPAYWPRTFYYVPNQSDTQGIHPPAPIYQSNQAQQPMYYQAGMAGAQCGYSVNGFYNPLNPNAAIGWPSSSYPYCTMSPTIPSAYPTCNWAAKYSPRYAAPQPFQYVPGAPYSASAAAAQVAAVIAANAAVAQAPNAPSFFFGPSAAEVAAQNAVYQAYCQQMMAAQAQTQPTQLAPYKPGLGPQFWCKEIDGSWTLRDQNDAVSLGIGHWETHPTTGYHYYVKGS